MRNSDLPNLRGLVTNGAGLKAELVRSLNQARTYASRSGAGYSPVGQALADFLAAAVTANRSMTRAASIAVTPTAVTKAAGATQQITLTGTYPDGVTQAVSPSDARVTYVSSAPAKATVSATGLITAVATGTANVTVTYQGRTAVVAVTVS